MEKLWTTTEVAQFLGIHEDDVEQLVRRGQLTGYKLGGQFLRFRPDQVQALKGTMSFRPTTDKPTPPRERWFQRLRDACYFYDFYLISASLLAVLVLYLVMAG
jgi:excisionase family DNA binding protein